MRLRLLNKAFSGIGWVASFSGCQLLCNLILTIILARLLSPEDYGVYALCLIVVNLLQVFSGLGINAAVIQIDSVDNIFFATGFSLICMLSCLVMLLSITALLILISLFPIFGASIESISLPLIVLIFALPFLSTADFFQSLYNRDLKFRKPSIINFTCYIIGFAIFSLLFAIFGFGFYSLIFAFFLQHLLRCLHYSFYLQKRPTLGFDREQARRILRYGVGFSVAKLGNVLALQVDNLIVGSLLGKAALGLYSRSYQIIMSPISIITTVVDRVLFPLMSRRQDKLSILRNSFLMLNGAIFSVFLPLSFVLFAYRSELVLILLGNAWYAASTPFGLLALAIPFRAGYRLSDIVSRARGYVYKRAIVQWVYATFVGLGGLIGTGWGLEGVAFGISVAFF